MMVSNLRARHPLKDGPRQTYLSPMGETVLSPSRCLASVKIRVLGLTHY